MKTIRRYRKMLQQLEVSLVCPLCLMTIKDRPLEKWEPRIEIPSNDPGVKQYAHTKCVEAADSAVKQ